MAGGSLPWCNWCQRRAISVTTRYGERATCTGCGSYSWDRKPLASARTHAARKAAHEVFDRLWRKPALLTRSEAYARLSAALGIPRPLCHMSMMSRETAERVPHAVDCIRTQLEDERLGIRTADQLDYVLATL